jgi:hypothetical protein
LRQGRVDGPGPVLRASDISDDADDRLFVAEDPAGLLNDLLETILSPGYQAQAIAGLSQGRCAG